MKMVETVIEKLDNLPPKASCFVEPADGARLIAKIWVRGQLKERRMLRATALPVGRYTVTDGTVVHSYDPGELMSELARHQDRVRMESDAFVRLATRIAKQLGGRLQRLETIEDVFVGYQVEPRLRARGIDAGLEDKKLSKLKRDFAGEAIVFRTRASGIGIAFAARDLDLIPRICERWYEDVDKLIRRLDAECGAHLERLAHDTIDLRFDRKPKDTKPIARLLTKIARKSELELESSADFVRDLLENRRLSLWWD